MVDYEELARKAAREVTFEFGSHICPTVTFGGWWRVDATYSSTESVKMVSIEKAVSHAMGKAVSDSFSMEGSVSGAGPNGGGSASGGGGKSKAGNKSDDNSRADKDVDQEAMKNATMDVKQSWKGGSSGTLPKDWRRSLDFSMSSNWKVISRDFVRCVGNWIFPEDPHTQRKLCEVWLHMYFEGPNAEANSVLPLDLVNDACMSSLDMSTLRQRSLAITTLWENAKRASKEAQCNEGESFKFFKFTPLAAREGKQVQVKAVRFFNGDEVINSSASVEYAGNEISTDFSVPKQMAVNTFLSISFAEAVPVTGFTIHLADGSMLEDPMSYELSGSNDKDGSYQKLLHWDMAELVKDLTTVKAQDGMDNPLRITYLEEQNVLGAAPGMVFDKNTGMCRLKQCWCGSTTNPQPGSKGEDCPKDGMSGCTKCCRSDQKAMCASMNCPSLNILYVNKPEGNTLCRGNPCSIDELELCCRSRFIGRNFKVQIKTTDSRFCGTNEDVWVSLRGPGFLPDWKKLDKSGYDDFEEGDDDTYVLDYDEDFQADTLCFKSHGWCIDRATVSNQYLAGSPSSELGELKDWPDIDHFSPHCKKLPQQ